MGESNHAKQFFCSFYCDSFTRDYDKCAEIDVDPQPATAFAAHLLEVCSPSVCGDKVELAKLLEGAPVNSLAPTFRRCNLPLFYRIRNGSLQLGSTASSAHELVT